MRFVLVLLLIVACGAAPAASLDQVLAAMDKTAASFRDMSAKLIRVNHTAVINDTSRETGTVLMKRSSARDIRLRIEFAEPDQRTVVFEKASAQFYYPKIQTLQVYNLGKQRSLVDQFLLLGFGSSGAELAKNYTLKATGEEQIAGEAVTRIELLPKAVSVQEHLKRAELWMTVGGYPAQQKFYQPSGDSIMISYTEIQINTNPPDQAFRLTLPKNVQTIYPQK